MIFSRYGVPEQICSDLGTQFISEDWKAFAKLFDFSIVLSSPHHHQGNGEAERAVKMVKSLLEINREEDFFLALLSYHSTPNEFGIIPAELFFSRHLQTRLPIRSSLLLPYAVPHQKYCHQYNQQKERMQAAFNRRHRTHLPPQLKTGDRVFLPDKGKEGTVKEKISPRSFVVSASDDDRIYRRNMTMLRPLDSNTKPPTPTDSSANSRELPLSIWTQLSQTNQN